MKTKYEVKFDVEAGKIPMVKLVKRLTGLGLKETKDLVEQVIDNFEFPRTIDVIVTEQQLGRFLVRGLVYGGESFKLISAKPLELSSLDLSYIKEVE
jgi:hypothetical protein